MSDREKKSSRVDLLNGRLLTNIILFALPLIASGILQQSFNSVDVAVVGHFTGRHALAAVGCTGPVIGLLINLFVGISVGVNVVIANYIGQRNSDGVRRSVSAQALLALVCGMLMLVIGETMARPVLELTGTPAEVLDDAVLYMRVFVLGLPFMIVYNFASAVLRSIGDTRRPFYSLVISGFVNVGFNLLFVIGMGMGVEGVAWGTVISNVVNASIVVGILMREQGDIHLDIRNLRFDGAQVRKICSIGVPAGVQGAVFALSNTFILSAINSFGAEAAAGSAAAINYEFYCYFPMSAIAQTAVAFISQNYGAGNFARIRRIFRLSLVLAYTISFALNAFIAWKADFFLSVFTTDPEVLPFADMRIHTVLLFQFIASYYEVAGSAMRGLGRSLTPTLIVICGTCVLRLVWVFSFPLTGGDFSNLLMIYPVTWVVASVIMGVAYRRVSRKAMRQSDEQTAAPVLAAD